MDKHILLVIDVQEKTMALLLGKEEFLKKVNAMITHFKKNKLPIIYVKQDGAGNLYETLNYDKTDYLVTKKNQVLFLQKNFVKFWLI